MHRQAERDDGGGGGCFRRTKENQKPKYGRQRKKQNGARRALLPRALRHSCHLLYDDINMNTNNIYRYRGLFILLLFFIRQTHTAQRKGRPPVDLAARCCPPQCHCTILGARRRKRIAAIPCGPALTLKPRSEPSLPCRPQAAAEKEGKKEKKEKQKE